MLPFDWKFYLSYYPDLMENGINNKEKAINHWINHGRNEGRSLNRKVYHLKK